MPRLSKDSIKKISDSVRYTKNVAKAKGTKGYRRPRPGLNNDLLLVELTEVDDTELPYYYSYREVEWNSDYGYFQIKQGGEEDSNAICLPYPTPFCRLGDVVALEQVSNSDDYFFSYPGQFVPPTRAVNLGNKGVLSIIDGGFVCSNADFDSDNPEPIKVHFLTRRAKHQDWYGLENTPYSGNDTIVRGSEVSGEDRGVYVFNPLNTSFYGGQVKCIWGGSCWEVSLRSCGG